MERWGVAVNSVYKDGHVYRLVGPWWAFFIEWVSDTACDLAFKLPIIPLPNLTICRDCWLGSDLMEPGENSTLKEWYGSVQDLLHSRLHQPVSQWCYGKYQETRMQADLDDLRPLITWTIDEEEQDSIDEPAAPALQKVRRQIKRLEGKREQVKVNLIRKYKNEARSA